MSVEGQVRYVRREYPDAARRIEAEARASLETALADLLDDTQHADHDCGDVDCPVSRARAVLARETRP